MVHPSSDCPHSDPACISHAALTVLCLAHIAPAALMLLDLSVVFHKLAYRNVFVESVLLLSYVSAYLIWSLVCSLLNKDWPYTVQSQIDRSKVVSFFLHLLWVAVFGVLYYVTRWLHHKRWNHAHGNKQEPLLTLEEEWQTMPKFQREYEISVFSTEDEVPYHVKHMMTRDLHNHSTPWYDQDDDEVIPESPSLSHIVPGYPGLQYSDSSLSQASQLPEPESESSASISSRAYAYVNS